MIGQLSMFDTAAAPLPIKRASLEYVLASCPDCQHPRLSMICCGFNHCAGNRVICFRCSKYGQVGESEQRAAVKWNRLPRIQKRFKPSPLTWAGEYVNSPEFVRIIECKRWVA